MIKIGYNTKNKTIQEKIWKLSSFDSEILIYELEKGTLNELIDLKIDVMILEITLKNKNRMIEFEKMKNDIPIKGIYLVNEYDDEIIQMILDYHIQSFSDLSISDITLYVMILKLMNQSKIHQSIYEQIENICHEKKIASHFLGYSYLKSAIMYYVENQQHEFLMKEVYDTIAKKHQTTSSRVEKNIRLAIKKSGSSLSNAKFIDACFRECING